MHHEHHGIGDLRRQRQIGVACRVGGLSHAAIDDRLHPDRLDEAFGPDEDFDDEYRATGRWRRIIIRASASATCATSQPSITGTSLLWLTLPHPT